MRRESGGDLFGGAKDEVGKRPLKGSEGWTVNVVNDHRNPRAASSEAAQHPRLAAVRVNDIRTEAAQPAGQIRYRETIFPGVNRSDERRHNVEQAGAAGQGRFKRPFGSRGGAGDELNVNAGLLPQT